jgi:hypothetical protein
MKIFSSMLSKTACFTSTGTRGKRLMHIYRPRQTPEHTYSQQGTYSISAEGTHTQGSGRAEMRECKAEPLPERLHDAPNTPRSSPCAQWLPNNHGSLAGSCCCGFNVYNVVHSLAARGIHSSRWHMQEMRACAFDTAARCYVSFCRLLLLWLFIGWGCCGRLMRHFMGD